VEVEASATSPASPSLQNAAAEIIRSTGTTAKIPEEGEEDECIIIEPLSTSALPSVCAAPRRVRCPECSVWLQGDALPRHLDEHVAQKYQVPLPASARLRGEVTLYLAGV
jgi:hypothetical protein